jgi:predicted amidohydrolase YtcJ
MRGHLETSGGAGAGGAVSGAEADTVLYNGRIITVDREFSIAQAAAIRDGVFLAVGKEREVLNLAGPKTRHINLAGKTVVPGFTDGHAHMDREGLKYLYPSLAGARSIADILRIVESEVKKAKPGEWAVTMPVGDPPFYQNVPGILKENRLPTRWELDTVSPDNPVYIRGIWGFWNGPPIVSIANSQALRLAGITRDVQPPYDGVTIHRDPDTGEPTGVFSEANFVPTVEFSLMKVVPRFTHELRLKGLEDSQKRYNAAGTTSIYEGHGVASEVVRVYKELWAGGALTVRSYLVMSPTPDVSAPDFETMVRDWATASDGAGIGDSMLKTGGLFIQSGGNASIARLLKAEAPYTAWGAYYYDALSKDRFRDFAFAAAKYGLRVNTIAPDQRSLDAALETFEEIDRHHPIAGRRWVVEHLAQVTPKNIETMKRLGVVPTVIPATSVWKGGAARLKQTSAEARERDTPYRSLMDGGLPLVLGTDNVPPEPFFTLWVTLTRKDRDSGDVLGPAQKLSREDALRAMTINGAHLSFEEKLKGSIEKGKYADLVVICEDYLTIPEDQIKDIRPVMTMVGGKIVYQRD